MKNSKKQELRKAARALRAELDTHSLSKEIIAQIRAWPIYLNSIHVLSYSAFASEIDLKALESDKKKFYLTRTNNDMDLSIHAGNCQLEKHKYGYLQPVAGLEPILPNTIELVLVPGLAFAVDGARLGYGKGYYDRLLAKMDKAVFAGVCARAQITKNIPQHKNDIAMHYLITENEVIKTS